MSEGDRKSRTEMFCSASGPLLCLFNSVLYVSVGGAHELVSAESGIMTAETEIRDDKREMTNSRRGRAVIGLQSDSREKDQQR